MARRGMRSRFRGARNYARTVYVRARSFRPRKKSNKKLLIIAGVAAGLFIFKDKLTALFAKK